MRLSETSKVWFVPETQTFIILHHCRTQNLEAGVAGHYLALRLLLEQHWTELVWNWRSPAPLPQTPIPAWRLHSQQASKAPWENTAAFLGGSVSTDPELSLCWKCWGKSSSVSWILRMAYQIIPTSFSQVSRRDLLGSKASIIMIQTEETNWLWSHYSEFSIRSQRVCVKILRIPSTISCRWFWNIASLVSILLIDFKKHCANEVLWIPWNRKLATAVVVGAQLSGPCAI